MIEVMPPAWQLLGFFCKEPDVSEDDEGSLSYSVEFSPGIEIAFSINIFIASIEIKVAANGELICSIYRENLEKISIMDDFLVCKFYDRQNESFLKIDSKRNFSFSFSELKVTD